MQCDARHALARRQFNQGQQMVIVRMYATVAKETDEVQCPMRFPGGRARCYQRWVGKECTILDRGTDAHEILHHDAARAEVHMTDFAIAHLSRRQPNRPTGRR